MEKEELKNEQLTYSITLPKDAIAAIEARCTASLRTRKVETEFIVLEVLRQENNKDAERN